MLAFKRDTLHARIILPTGETADRPIEIRIHPITGRNSRITYSRAEENEPGAGPLPAADRRHRRLAMAGGFRPRGFF